MTSMNEIMPSTYLIDMAKEHTKWLFGLHLKEKWLPTRKDNKLFVNPVHGELFRGENEVYDSCFPNAYRGLVESTKVYKCSIGKQAELVIRNAKTLRFTRYELPEHPVIKLCEKVGFYYDKTAVAQHYELATSYLDLTHDFSVAAFFATCYKEGEEWKPIKKGVGVIHKLTPSEEWSQELRKNNIFIPEPLGFQLMLRPTEQSAWTLEIPFAWNFLSYPTHKRLKFFHSEEVGQYFLDLFYGGNKLFPFDPLSNVADKVKKSQDIEEKIVDDILAAYSEFKWGIRDKIAVKDVIAGKLNFQAKQEPVYIFEEDKKAMEDAKDKAWWELCMTSKSAYGDAKYSFGKNRIFPVPFIRDDSP